jgi:soluble lytic murein transglycosylase-like protein
MLILLSIFLLGSLAPAQGETYLRVRKNGVVRYYFSTRPSTNPLVAAGSRRGQVLRPLSRNLPSPDKLEPLIHEVSRQQNLPPSLVKAVIQVESNFNPGATSPKGAQGLMQLMPGTAEDLQVVNPYDVHENVWAGTRYLKMLLEKFHYRLPLALAAYNAGPKRVDRHQDVPPIRETQDFVRDVCANFLKYNGEQHPEKMGQSAAPEAGR